MDKPLQNLFRTPSTATLTGDVFFYFTEGYACRDVFAAYSHATNSSNNKSIKLIN